MTEGIEGIIAVAARPFFDEGYDHVVVAWHCEKLYVGVVKPECCGSCGETDPEKLGIICAQPDGRGGIEWAQEAP